MIAALDGVDLIVFTGGIGENDGEARAAICGGLSWIGVSLDEAQKRSANNPINDPASRCSVLVLASQEDEQIARHTWALFPRNSPGALHPQYGVVLGAVLAAMQEGLLGVDPATIASSYYELLRSAHHVKYGPTKARGCLTLA